jgi:hypothetical protein
VQHITRKENVFRDSRQMHVLEEQAVKLLLCFALKEADENPVLLE